MTDDEAMPDDQPLEQVQHASPTARLPEAVGKGVFATGAIILGNTHEIVIDFVQGIANPCRVAARVVLPPAVAFQFAAALEGNLGRYAETFGGPPRVPSASPAAAEETRAAPEAAAAEARSPLAEAEAAVGASEPAGPRPAAAARPPARPSAPPPAQPIADIYEQIRLPDDLLGGVYANVVSIVHTATEFSFDFIANVYPRSVVTARVYLAAPRVPDVLASLQRSLGPRRPAG